MIGALLFQNVNRIDWSNLKDSAPAFCVLFFIPFMYSVVEGVLMGYYVYIFIGIFTGDFLLNCSDLMKAYFPSVILPIERWGLLKRRNSNAIDDNRIAAALSTFREGRGRARSMSNARTRAGSLSASKEKSSRPKSDTTPAYDPSYEYEGGYDATYDPTLAAIAENDDDLKAMRSVQFAVFD
jgi:hypothetical protein